MDLFIRPDGLTLIAHSPCRGCRPGAIREKTRRIKRGCEKLLHCRQTSEHGTTGSLSPSALWWRARRVRFTGQIPDVENIQTIVDAFTGVLFPDDDIRYVRGAGGKR